MAEPPEKLKSLLATLSFFEDRNDRIQMLVDIAERFKPVPESVATRPYPEDRKVPGCESEVYVWSRSNGNDTLKFHFAVENPQGVSAKALAVILDETLSGARPEEVAAVEGDLIYEIFGRELSMGKSMGLMNMIAVAQVEAKRLLAGPARHEAPH